MRSKHKHELSLFKNVVSCWLFQYPCRTCGKPVFRPHPISHLPWHLTDAWDDFAFLEDESPIIVAVLAVIVSLVFPMVAVGLAITFVSFWFLDFFASPLARIPREPDDHYREYDILTISCTGIIPNVAIFFVATGRLM